ncbi:MAG: L-aspartate oxidase [Planctomycetes bacterium]|nr:L-aspartate oxidase [Planctomycetota bacterium]
MASLFDTRRYLTDFDSSRTGHIVTDVLIIGTGVAGARAALEASRFCSVILMTKSAFDESATNLAQGGIAAAVGEGDSPDDHLADTMRVGCGLNRRDAVELLVRDAPDRIRELIDWGMDVDRAGGRIVLGREGGHGRDRIVHARGDRTGRSLVETLRRRVNDVENIRIFEHCVLIDLLTIEGECVGAVAYHRTHGHQLIWAGRTILATGGCGRIWRETTNPPQATGDGIAAAYRAGAVLCDMEMMQFHPTTLYVAGSGRALISEAVRGEGAFLVDRDGNRFMNQYHPDGELAPRDVVSRAIHRHLRETRANCVYLDARHIKGFRERFPHISALCADFEIDVTRDVIPVRPSAHYMIGGVDVDLDGRSSLTGLICCGESASTGVHGANRIASNSLLEGLVFGRRAGIAAGRDVADGDNGADGKRSLEPPHVRRVTSRNSPSVRTPLDLADIANSLRSLMWRNMGIDRFGDRLRETLEIVEFWGHYTLDKTFDTPVGWEMQNKLTLGRLMAMSALARTESIGVHYRSDASPPGESKGTASLHSETPKPNAAYHLYLTRDPNGTTPERRACGGE